ncbi:MAG: rod shape-determining protein [bacterium]
MFLSKLIGIDLGTKNTLVYEAGRGITMNEPTVVAVADENIVLAVGREAEDMIGRTPETIQAICPMKDGVIADYVVTEAMLRYFINKSYGRFRFTKPTVMICVPGGGTSTERKAALDASVEAGAREAYLIEEPLAAAIGAGIPISSPSGSMIVDIGGGTSEAAVIALGGIVASNSVRVGGNKIDESIATYVRKTYNLLIGDRSAEDIKKTIGSATKLTPDEKMEVRGRDLIAGLPRTITISSHEVTQAVLPALKEIMIAVKSVLERTPPELSSDVIDKGIILTGGGALLRNLDQLMAESLGVSCQVADEPLYCVIKGIGIALENIDLFKRSINLLR